MYVFCFSKAVFDYLLKDLHTNLDSQNYESETPLLIATITGLPEYTLQLINAGCDLNMPNNLLQTPLHISAQNSELLDIMHQLIQWGANKEAADYFKNTPLIEAVRVQNEEAVCMLLYYNADANVACEDGYTPLIIAVGLGHDFLFNVLIDYQSDLFSRNRYNETVISLAMYTESNYFKEIVTRITDIWSDKKDVTLLRHMLYLDDGYDLFRKSWEISEGSLDVPFLGSLLFEVLCNGDFNDASWSKNLNLIVGHHRIGDVFLLYPKCTGCAICTNYLTFNCIISKLIIHMKHRNISKEDRLKLLYIFLSSGVDIYLSDIALAYKYFQFGQELDILFSFDHIKDGIRIIQESPVILTILSPERPITPSLFSNRSFKYPYEIYKFCSDPYGSLLANHSKTDIFSCKYINKFPSLLELSRNAVRINLAKNTKTIYAFFKGVHYLDCPKILKDIICFKKQLYNVVVPHISATGELPYYCDFDFL